MLAYPISVTQLGKAYRSFTSKHQNTVSKPLGGRGLWKWSDMEDWMKNTGKWEEFKNRDLEERRPKEVRKHSLEDGTAWGGSWGECKPAKAAYCYKRSLRRKIMKKTNTEREQAEIGSVFQQDGGHGKAEISWAVEPAREAWFSLWMCLSRLRYLWVLSCLTEGVLTLQWGQSLDFFRQPLHVTKYTEIYYLPFTKLSEIGLQVPKLLGHPRTPMDRWQDKMVNSWNCKWIEWQRRGTH